MNYDNPYTTEEIPNKNDDLLFSVGEAIQTRSHVKTPIDPVKQNKS